MKKTIIIISPGPSAVYLSKTLSELGFHTVAIFTDSMEGRDPYFRISSELFDQQLHFDKPEMATLVAAAKRLNPIYIINGSDDSAPITDYLMQALLPDLANDPTTSADRFDKYRMQEALRKHGLPYIHQRKVAKKDLFTLNTDDLCFPCFCKPTNGIATVGGFKAENAESFRKGVAENINANHSEEYLIQEFIDGDEFVVDSFSYQGQHFISSVQKYHKRLIGETPAYCYCEIVTDPAVWEACANFLKNCLDATGLKNGFAHSEIFRLADQSFRLCEINPRISGIRGYYNQSAKSSNLTSQPELLAQYLASQTVQESHLRNQKKYGRFLCLYNFSEHPLQDPKQNLTAFHSVQFYDVLKPIGTPPAQGPKNLAATDLLVLLAHTDPHVIEQETQALLALENQGKLL